MHLKLFAHGTKRLYKEPVMLMVTPAEKNLQLAFKDVIDSPDYDDYDILKQFGPLARKIEDEYSQLHNLSEDLPIY